MKLHDEKNEEKYRAFHKGNIMFDAPWRPTRLSCHFLSVRTVLVMAFILPLCTALPSIASTTTVTSLADDGSPGTLRYAVENASSGDTINFGVTGTIVLTTNEIGINKSLSITGPGANSLAINGNLTGSQTCFCRVFSIGSGITVNISGVTIENGSNYNGGGGIINSGTLTLTNSTVSGNDAVFGGGSGGGIFNNGGTLTLNNSTVSGNSAGRGSGIYNNGGVVTLTNSTVSGNHAFYGTGIYNASGTLTLNNSTVSSNPAGTDGGGIYNDSGTLMLTSSTVSGNGANYGGGGIFNSGTATISNSTLSGNFSFLTTGGGIFNPSGTLRLNNSTLSGNSAGTDGGGIYNGGTLEVKNTIVANSPSGGNCFWGTGTAASDGHNLSDDTSCSSFFTQTGDVNNTPAGLDPSGLQNNGGPTQTIALLATSPAVNAIPLNPTNYCTDVGGNPVTTDQRGVARPQGAACDIGALELAADNDTAYAQVSGGNNFSGNQNVNGTILATAFVGDGSGLAGVNAATAVRAQSAAAADTASFATTAGDAATLGGFSANAFAPATGSPTYVAKAGDTMTGTLNLAADGLIAGGNQLVLSSGNVGIGTTTPENLPGYRSLHIDSSVTGFGGAFLELTHSTTGQKGRVVMDDNGFLLNSVNSAPVKIKSSNFNSGNDPGHIYVSTSGNVGIGTGTPAAKLDVNGTANFSGLVTFASGQTFPGAGNGTITAVTAGNGLSGGGSAGNVTLNNAGVLSVAGSGVLSSSGGQNPTISLTGVVPVANGGTGVSSTGQGFVLAGPSSGAGAPAFRALVASDIPSLSTSYVQLTPSAPQIAALQLTNSTNGATTGQFLEAGSTGPGIGVSGQSVSVSGTGVQGVALQGVAIGVHGISSGNGTGVLGESTSGSGHGAGVAGMGFYGVSGSAYGTGAGAGVLGNNIVSPGPGVLGQNSMTGGIGVEGTVSGASATAGVFDNQSTSGKVLSLRNNGAEKASVDIGGNIVAAGNVATTGSVIIGGGTPIVEHLSGTFTLTVPAVAPNNCATLSPVTFSGASDGDTIALGIKNALTSGGNLTYFAWVSATNTITIKVCNPHGTTNSSLSGTIRVDIWKH